MSHNKVHHRHKVMIKMISSVNKRKLRKFHFEMKFLLNFQYNSKKRENKINLAAKLKIQKRINRMETFRPKNKCMLKRN